MDSNLKADNPAEKEIDGHRLSEFVYGIVTGMVAISGINISQPLAWSEAASIIIVGAAAIWLAHAYAILMGNRIASGRRMNQHDIGKALYGSWPIVTAGFLLALPLLATAFGFLPLQTSLRLSSILGLVLLAFVGFTASVITKESWPRRILLAAVTVGLGLLVILIELIVHH